MHAILTRPIVRLFFGGDMIYLKRTGGFQKAVLAGVLLMAVGAAKPDWIGSIANLTSSTAHASVSSAAPTGSDGDAYAQTKYPIILVHGLAGTDKFFGVIEYWYGIAEDLQAHGATVYTANLTNFQTEEGPDGRGEQLLKYVKAVLVATGAKKVNLIAHSQGGLTSRYVASVAPELVASITTIASPHLGTEFADFVVGLYRSDPTGIVGGVLSSLQNTFGYASSSQHYTNQDAAGAWEEMSLAEMKNFNSRFPTAGIDQSGGCDTGAAQENVNGNIHLMYSWTGAAIVPKQGLLGKYVVDTSVGMLDPAYLDLTTSLMQATGKIMVDRGAGAGDGLASSCRTHYGTVISDKFNWNHLDEVNQMFGILGANAENPVMVIRAHANRLKLAGV